MRARLLTTVLALIVLVLVGLGVPFAASIAGGEQQRLFLDRLTDTTRFASLAQRPVIDNQATLVEPELRRYDDVHHIAAAVVNREGQIVATSRPGVGVADEP